LQGAHRSPLRLTRNDHHADREDPLVVGLGGHVAEPHRRHARHGEVERRHVHRLPGGAVDQLGRVGVVGPHVRVGTLGYVGQLPQPAVLDAVVGVRPAYGVPDAGQPVGHQHVEAQQQDEHGGAVLQVAVQLADHAAQPQQAHHLQGAEEAPDALKTPRKPSQVLAVQPTTYILVVVEGVEDVVRQAAQQIDDEPALEVVHPDDFGVGDDFSPGSHKSGVKVQNDIDEEYDVDDGVDHQERNIFGSFILEGDVVRDHYRRVKRETQNDPVPDGLESAVM
jgi:hypothetical protein